MDDRLKELRELALTNPIARADQVLDRGHFLDAFPWRFGLTVNK